MKNKVLIKLYVPEIDYTFDLFIPVNEVVWKIKKLLVKSVNDLTGVNLNMADEFALINKNTSSMYDNNEIIEKANVDWDKIDLRKYSNFEFDEKLLIRVQLPF